MLWDFLHFGAFFFLWGTLTNIIIMKFPTNRFVSALAFASS